MGGFGWTVGLIVGVVEVDEAGRAGADDSMGGGDLTGGGDRTGGRGLGGSISGNLEPEEEKEVLESAV